MTRWVLGQAFPQYTREDALIELAEMNTPEAEREHQAWLATRPPLIRELFERYPRNQFYRVRRGAPYRGSAPGSVVAVAGFCEDGDAIVVVFRHPDPLYQLPVRTYMKPEWLDPIALDEAFPPEDDRG